jgi:hypothetical protein
MFTLICIKRVKKPRQTGVQRSTNRSGANVKTVLHPLLNTNTQGEKKIKKYINCLKTRRERVGKGIRFKRVPETFPYIFSQICHNTHCYCFCFFDCSADYFFDYFFFLLYFVARRLCSLNAFYVLLFFVLSPFFYLFFCPCSGYCV